MPVRPIEQLPYRGESPQDRGAFTRYMGDVSRGKSLLALMAMRDALTPATRACWFEGTFGAIETSEARFDELTCNLSYHFAEHGHRYGTIANMTGIAMRHFKAHRGEARAVNGVLKFPNGSMFTLDGKIVPFI